MTSNEELLSMREKNRVLTEENNELRKELQLIGERIKELEEENQRLKELNQQFRLILYNFKPPKKEQSGSSDDVPQCAQRYQRDRKHKWN